MSIKVQLRKRSKPVPAPAASARLLSVGEPVNKALPDLNAAFGPLMTFTNTLSVRSRLSVLVNVSMEAIVEWLDPAPQDSFMHANVTAVTPLNGTQAKTLPMRVPPLGAMVPKFSNKSSVLYFYLLLDPGETATLTCRHTCWDEAVSFTSFDTSFQVVEALLVAL